MQDLMAIPGSVDEDDWSEDEFDGYVESDVDADQGVFVERENDGGMGNARRVGRENDRECSVESQGEGRDRNVPGDLVEDDAEGAISDFTSTPGCTQAPGNTPLDFFQLMVTDVMLDDIVAQTRLYASQFIDSHTINPRSCVQQWPGQEFDRDEMKKFLALIIIMGLVNLPQLEDQWVTSWPYSNETCSKVYTWLYTNMNTQNACMNE